MTKSSIFSVGLIAAGLLVALPANAAVVVSVAGGNLNPMNAVAGATYTDFNSVVALAAVAGGLVFSNANGGSLTFTGDGAIATGSVSGSYAQPAATTGNFLSTGYNGSAGTFATEVALTGYHNYIGFYWGSIDTYNTFNLYDGTTLVGTVVGNQVGAPANGNQADGDQNRFVNISSDLLFNRVEFVTGSPAFEISNIALTAAVPEASTWAMMILGFLGLGFLGYRKSSKAGNAAFRMA